MYKKPAAPQLIGGVLDSAIGLYKTSFRQIFGLAIAASLANSLPGLFDDRLDRLMAGDFDPTQTSTPWLIATIIGLLVSLFIGMAAIARMNAVAQASQLAVGQALVEALRRLPGALVYLLACFGVVLASMVPIIGFTIAFGPYGLFTLMLVVPLGVLLLYWYFTIFLLITDRIGPFAAMRRSFQLVRGHWWRTAAMLLVAYFIQLAVVALVGVVSAVAGAVASDGSVSVATVIFVVNVVSGAVTTPFIFATSLAILGDLQLRRGGEDLAQRIAGAQT